MKNKDKILLKNEINNLRRIYQDDVDNSDKVLNDVLKILDNYPNAITYKYDIKTDGYIKECKNLYLTYKKEGK